MIIFALIFTCECVCVIYASSFFRLKFYLYTNTYYTIIV